MNMRHLTAGAMAGAALLVLAACAGTPAGGAISGVQSACVSVQPLLSAGAASGNPTARQIASYGNAVCGPLAGGMVPATVDASTPTWLGSLGGMLKVLLPLAVGLL